MPIYTKGAPAVEPRPGEATLGVTYLWNQSESPGIVKTVQKLESEVESLSRQLERHQDERKRHHRELLDTVAGWVAEARREVFDLREELRPMIGRAAHGNRPC